jgi:hypothetical protein
MPSHYISALIRLAVLVCSFATSALAQFTFSPNTMNVGANGGTNFNAQVIANQSITWQASSNQAWLTLTPPASGTGNGSITYSVDGNPTGASREATVRATGTGGVSTTLVVTQLGGVLSTSPSSANVQGPGGSGTITVSTEDQALQWTASSNMSWLTVTSGSTGIGPASVQWNAAANTTVSGRTAIITIAPVNGVGSTFTVTQGGSTEPQRLTLSPNSINADAAGATGSIQVSANVSWTAASSPSFVTITGGAGAGNGVIQYAVQANPTAVSRTGSITASSSGLPNATVSVTQSGGVLVVSPSSGTAGPSGGTGSISLTTTDNALQWTVQSNQPWLTTTPISGGTGPATIQWSATDNQGGSARSGVITITSAGGSPQTVSISQEKGNPGTISVNPQSVTAPASVSNGVVQVTTSNQSLDWTISSDQPWLTVTSIAGGKGNGSFQYQATGNTTAATRTATILVTASNGATTTFTVTQQATTFAINPTAASAGGTGGTGSFTFTTNNTTLQWSASSSQTWLTFTVTAGPTLQNVVLTGTGDAIFNWVAGANPGGTTRTATIVITPSGGTPLAFTVTQSGLSGALTVTPSPLSFSYQQGSSAPAASQLTVRSGDVALPFQAAASTPGSASWLSVSPGTTTAPAVLNVSVNPAGLAVGEYHGSITITSGSATNSPVTIPVTFTVTPAPTLAAQPNQLSFAFQQNGPAPQSRTLTLTSSGVPLDYTIVQDASAPWLSATGAGPTDSTLTVSVTPGNLLPATYEGHVTLIAPAAGNSPFTIPVSLVVSAAPSLLATPRTLSLTYRQLDVLPTPINLGVTSSGTQLNFSTSVSAATDWLSITQIAPASTASGQTPSNVSITINPTGLIPGSYQGAIILTSTGAGNNPFTVPVDLTVLPSTLTALPQQLSFTVTQGGVAGPASITISSESPVDFTPSAQTSSGGNWLTVLPAGAQQSNSILSVSVSAANLTPGSYSGSIVLTSSHATNSPVTIPVNLTVTVQPHLTAVPTQLAFFYQSLSGLTPPPEFLIVTSLGQPGTPVAATVSTVSGGDWLSTGGGFTTPGSLRVNVNPAGLAAGTYSGTVTLSSSGYASTSIPVTFRVLAAPVLNTQPSSLSFSYQQGTTAPLAQTVQLTSSSILLPFSVSNGGTPWLSVTGGGVTPNRFSVSVNPAGLSPGTYTGNAVITSALAGNSPLTVPVQLTVTAAPTIFSQPSSLSFSYTQQSTLPIPQTLSIGSSAPLTLHLTTSTDESWLTVTGSGPALDISVDPSGLTPGQYSAVILVTADGAGNNPLSIPVSLTVLSAPALTSARSALTFSYQLQGALPANQVITLDSSDETLVVTAAADTQSGGNWLSVMGGGNLPATFSITVNPAGLTPGTYQGSITLTADRASGPLTIPVTLLVTSAPILSSAPSQLGFSYQISGTVPPSASLQVTSSGGSLPFQVTGTTASGGPWLQVSSGGTTARTETVSVNPIGLIPGTYTGTIELSSASAGNSPLVVPVTLTVTTSADLSAAPASLQFTAQVNGSAPAPRVVQLTAGGAQIGVTYSTSPGASWLTSTGDPATPGNLTVSVSPAGLTPGRYAAVILVKSDFAANSPLEIPITFDVAATPVLSASPSQLRYTYDLSGTKPPLQTFSVTSSGAPADFTVSVVPGPAWLFASGSGTSPANISVTVDPSALAPGDYQATVLVTPTDASAVPIQVPILLTVSSAPLLSAQPSLLTFAYQINGPVPPSQSFVISSDRGTHHVTLGTGVTTRLFDGAGWLALTGGGDTPAAVNASVIPTGLTPGVYKGQILASASGAGNSPLAIPVSLVVTTAPSLTIAPASLTFASQIGSTAPPNQQIALSSTDGSALPIGSVAVSNGISWLAATANASTTPATLTVSANPAGLSAGVYQASIVVSSPTAGNSPSIIPVTLTIAAQPSLTVSAPAVVFASGSGSSSPQSLTVNVNSTGTALTFSTSVVGGSPWLSVSGGGATPGAIQLGVNPAGLTGVYGGSVVITSAGAANNPLILNVQLIVTSAPLLNATPASLTFSGTSTSSIAPQTVQVSSALPCPSRRRFRHLRRGCPSLEGEPHRRPSRSRPVRRVWFPVLTRARSRSARPAPGIHRSVFP